MRFSKSNTVSYFHHEHAVAADDANEDSEPDADESNDIPIGTKFDALNDALKNAESQLKQTPFNADDLMLKESGGFNADDYDDLDEPLKFTESDTLYDSRKDRIDEDWCYQKYAQNAVIQSDCTLCCANCFVFISYVSQKLSMVDILAPMNLNVDSLVKCG